MNVLLEKFHHQKIFELHMRLAVLRDNFVKACNDPSINLEAADAAKTLGNLADAFDCICRAEKEMEKAYEKVGNIMVLTSQPMEGF